MADGATKNGITPRNNEEHLQTRDDKDVGQKQQLVLATSEPPTRLVLGEWVSEPKKVGLASPFGFPGISMQSNEHFFARIGEHAVFQVGENATFQAKNDWTLFSKNLDIATTEKTHLASGQSISIAAGPTDRFVPPSDGPKLRAPSFDRGAVEALLLDHSSAMFKSVTKSFVTITELRAQLGLGPPEKPANEELKGVLAAMHTVATGLRKVKAVADHVTMLLDVVDAAAPEIQKVKSAYEKAGGSKKVADTLTTSDKLKYVVLHLPEILLASSPGAESGESGEHSLTARESVEGVGEGTEKTLGLSEHINKVLEQDEATNEAREKTASSSSPPPSGGGLKNRLVANWKSANEPIKFKNKSTQDRLDNIKSKARKGTEHVSHAMGAISAAATDGEREYDRAQSYLKAYKEKHKQLDGAKDLTDWLLAMNALGNEIIKDSTSFAKEIADALDNQVANWVLNQSDPKISIAAKHKLQLSSGNHLEAYAKDGFALESNEGGFHLRTHGAIEVNSLESAHIEADKHVSLHGGLDGAELAALGYVGVGSRTKQVEVLGESIELGTLDPAKSTRNGAGKGLDKVPWSPGQQHATKTLQGAATDAVMFQAGGGPACIKPDEVLTKDTPTALRLNQAKGSVEAWGSKTIQLQADEKEGVVRISVGQFAIVVNKNEISIGHADDDKGRPNKPSLVIDENSVWVKSGDGTELNLLKTKGLFQKGDALVKVEDGGTKIDGKKINLG